MHIYMCSMYINKTKTLANGLQIHRVMYVLVYYIYICKCGCVYVFEYYILVNLQCMRVCLHIHVHTIVDTTYLQLVCH